MQNNNKEKGKMKTVGTGSKWGFHKLCKMGRKISLDSDTVRRFMGSSPSTPKAKQTNINLNQTNPKF